MQDYRENESGKQKAAGSLLAHQRMKKALPIVGSASSGFA